MRTRQVIRPWYGLPHLYSNHCFTKQLLDALETEVPSGGYILDWHACDLFPKSWIDLVVVLRCNSTVLYDRLTARKYSAKKLEENMDAEIMQVLLEEAREGFDEEIVVELQSDSLEDIDANVERIQTWIENWKEENKAQSKEKD
jgi:adenylate kinase